jgi:hypothetical protein
MRSARRVLVIALAIVIIGLPARTPLGSMPAYAADDDPIPATQGLNQRAPFACNAHDLGEEHNTARADPQWSPILLGPQADPVQAFLHEPPVVLEGVVPAPPPSERATSQTPSEVAEEDTPWNHHSHDKTTFVVPDAGYRHLLSSYVTADGQTAEHPHVEVEWEQHALPRFVWPSVGDRVWVEGQWVFDCGHVGPTDDPRLVRFSTEIHPPRALTTFRQVPGAPLPLTGAFTDLPVTQADMFVSGNGGYANTTAKSLTGTGITLLT